tara:strand:+ start:138 stop:539 length:402 start_codon:yes stop_codon:yes gene_type:complete
MGTKESIDNIWERYAKTLKLLSNALDALDKKPKEVIVEKIVEVEKVVEVPIEVEKIVEVQGPEMYPLKTQSYELRIKQLESQIQGLKKQLETFGVVNEDLERKYQEMVNEFGSLSDFDLDMKDTSWMPATRKK